ncbi:hypothetical protein C7S15_5997 [Burkholderia cepacia]|nr:hypothetical protein [Burkholderia cepacia]
MCHAEKTGCGCGGHRVDRRNSTGIAFTHPPIVSHPLHKREM